MYLPAGFSGPRSEIGRVGQDQLKLVAPEQTFVPQVPGQDRPGEGIVRQILPGQLRCRGVQLDAHPR